MCWMFVVWCVLCDEICSVWLDVILLYFVLYMFLGFDVMCGIL